MPYINCNAGQTQRYNSCANQEDRQGGEVKDRERLKVAGQAQAHTRAHFDAASAYWQQVYSDSSSYTGYALQKLHQEVLQRVREYGEGLRVLDVGCGAGVTARALAAAGHTVSGVDLAPEMIARARGSTAQQGAVQADLRLEFNVASALALPYASASVDVLLALGLLANLPDAGQGLAELRRVLKPGGLLLLTMPNLLALDVLLALPLSLPLFANATPLRRPLRRAGNLGRRLAGRATKDPDAIRFGYSVLPWLFADTLRLQGFRNIQVQALAYGPLMPLGVWRLGEAEARRVSEWCCVAAQRVRGLRGLGSVLLFAATR